jgi:hypothetical protein
MLPEQRPMRMAATLRLDPGAGAGAHPAAAGARPAAAGARPARPCRSPLGAKALTSVAAPARRGGRREGPRRGRAPHA